MPDFSFSYKEFDSADALSDQNQRLIRKTIESCNNAHAPYSKFKVGCAVLLSNDSIVFGTNVENASYPVGICAERTALSHVVSNYPDEQIIAMAIAYQPNSDYQEFIFPCGMCRQFILECQQRNKKPIALLLHAPNGKVTLIENAADLLPFGFTGDAL